MTPASIGKTKVGQRFLTPPLAGLGDTAGVGDTVGLGDSAEGGLIGAPPIAGDSGVAVGDGTGVPVLLGVGIGGSSVEGLVGAIEGSGDDKAGDGEPASPGTSGATTVGDGTGDGAV